MRREKNQMSRMDPLWEARVPKRRRRTRRLCWRKRKIKKKLVNTVPGSAAGEVDAVDVPEYWGQALRKTSVFKQDEILARAARGEFSVTGEPMVGYLTLVDFFDGTMRVNEDVCTALRNWAIFLSMFDDR